jgi:acetyl-CoA carboxylase carboxyl transferase subunit beta
MSWLTNVVRPKLRELVGGSREIPENLWHQCPACNEMIFHRDLNRHQRVCPHCGHHMRLGVEARLEALFDGGEYQLIEPQKSVPDPLKFRDLRRYTDRLKEAQSKTGNMDALVVATGTVGDVPIVAAVFNFQFMGGSMGAAVGNAFVAAAKLAVALGAAFVAIPASGGARMQEGIFSLMQMARTTRAVQEVREAELPYIVVLSDPTTGGVSASFAMLGDITLAEPGAVIGFAGARVIEQTIRESLPDGFQRAEYLRDHGMVDAVVKRQELPSQLGLILDLLTNTRPPSHTAFHSARLPENETPVDMPLEPEDGEGESSSGLKHNTE